MGNKVSVSEMDDAAGKLYEKMTAKGAYGQVRKSWEVTKVFVTKATLGVVSKITTFLSKCKFPRAAAIGAVGGVGVALLIGCIVADRLVNEPEDIKLVVETAIRKVFIEEKAHKICSTINAYQNRRRIFANNKQKCCEELIKYERKLFNQLQLFSDIMRKEPQNATVLNLYAWLKSARCHLEMFSEMVHFGVSDAGELRRAAEMHCSTLTPLVAAVKDQKAKVIRLIPLLFGIRLTDKEVGQSVIIFHPCSNTDAIKDKYLTLVFNEQVKSAEEEFKSLVADFQKNSCATLLEDHQRVSLWSACKRAFCNLFRTSGGNMKATHS